MRPIELKLQETPHDPGTNVCLDGPGHMMKMDAMPIYGNNPLKIFFSRTGRPVTLGPTKFAQMMTLGRP